MIAARITGHGRRKDKDRESAKNAKSADINVVFVADMDMISNAFFYVRDKEFLNLKTRQRQLHSQRRR